MLRPMLFMGFVMFLASVLCLMTGCGEGADKVRPEGLTRIVVSIPPIAWAVQELAPEGAEIRVLLQQGQSEHGASLSASDAAAIRKADLVFLVGWGLESSAERLVRDPPNWQRVVRMSGVVEGADLDLPEHDHSEDCEHGCTGHHHHYATDPHAWLDPHAMAHWVRAVGDALGADADRIEELVSTCLEIDGEYASALVDLPRRHIVTHHNAYGWIAQRYNLEVAAVIRPNELLETTPGELSAAVSAVRELGIGAAFIEPQFSDRAATRLRELTGVRLLPIDPLGSGDWPQTMRSNLASLVEGLSIPSPAPQPLPSEN